MFFLKKINNVEGTCSSFRRTTLKKSLVFFYSFPKLARLKQVILLDREFIQDSENIYFCILIICRKQDILTILNMSVECMQYIQ